MTTEEKVARRKLSLLELAKDLQNVSKACKPMGYSRQKLYEIHRNYQTFTDVDIQGVGQEPGPTVHPVRPRQSGAGRTMPRARRWGQCVLNLAWQPDTPAARENRPPEVVSK
ncbi:hypothetical protein GCM10008997_23680 [Halomonas salifodinae]